MKFESVQLPFGQPITEAYINRSNPGVEALFGSHAAEPAHWEKRLNWLNSHADKRTTASGLADALARYNAVSNNQPAVNSNIDAIRAGAPVVVTGQQAGLWTGPLLVIHKAVTVIAAAREAASKLGTPVVPVFWIAGEDHDWDEANHAFVRSASVSGNGESAKLSRVAIKRPSGVRTSVSRTKLAPDAWVDALQRLSQELPDTEFKPDMLLQLEQAAKQAESLSDLFAATLSLLFGKYGLVLLDADEPVIRALEAPMFEQMITRNDELEAAYVGAASDVQELGFKLSADVTPGSANLFMFDEGERVLLHKDEGGFRNRKSTKSWTSAELLDVARNEPQQLSNNVLTRPIMQDYVLPVLAVVLGPGEIAYWALTGRAFHVLGMEMPIVVPRMSYTLVEQTAAKYMTKFELSFDDIAHRYAARREAWLKERDELGIEARFAEVKAQFKLVYQPVMDMAAGIQQGLRDLSESNLQRIERELAYMEARTKDAHARRFDTALSQMDWAAVSLWPDGKPQERVLNMADFWNRYGLSWVDKLLEAPYSSQGGHWMIYL
ncbi:bacillithiol biosynthesis cysteine-adding enzyme BshC [Paenibacillus sp. OV219]|uniref:bacillithiol biosynthesis cysteine-adding enzyme BshC n=1 Tax=Paenibacillus sp. OV219 TaxID=1884377 RepID=UPI0008AC682C|nr:bacillithiol biosynthesis cysteine-adding enzyme BshC [Paenibacillus sp. OV219]SEN11287.1 bacillithiol biosynthesis cysteine-adding enzyme BshC [Paenibacillus sp. OV219]